MHNAQTKVMTPPFVNYMDEDNKDFLRLIDNVAIQSFKDGTRRETICNTQNLDAYMEIVHSDP
jgi:hypothetical protein